VARCSKHYYADQASARRGLAHVRKPPKPGRNVAVRVYPCDVCDGWHLTSKRSRGKTPPWELDPNWRRPTLDGLERRGRATKPRPRASGAISGAAKIAKPLITVEVKTARLVDGKVVTHTSTEKVRPFKPRKAKARPGSAAGSSSQGNGGVARATGGSRQRARLTTGERVDEPRTEISYGLSRNARRKLRRYGKKPSSWR
jgi:hypothetical protein